MKQIVKHWIVFYFLIVAFIIFTNTIVLQLSYVPSESMEPAIQKGSFLLGSRWDKNILNRNDIVTFKYNKRTLVKRIIGLPREEISIIKGTVYINGKKIEEPFLAEPMMITKDLKITVPDDCIFVLGDNRNNSNDSRVIGCIKKENVQAKVRYEISPRIRKTH